MSQSTESPLPQRSELTVPFTLWHFGAVMMAFTLGFTIFFWPVVGQPGMLMAPADGIVYHVPAFLGHKALWNPLLFSGYPLMADLQIEIWYPIARLFQLFPQGWNGFVISGYVLAGSFAYAYGYLVTRSRLAAAVTGVAYSLSGYMFGHFGNVSMIHAAAWIPLLLCAVEQLRHRGSRMWFVLGAIAIACSFLSGHPQVSVYGVGISLYYALVMGWILPIGRRKYYSIIGLMILAGLGLTAIQLVPTAELSRLSSRSALTKEMFFSFSLAGWHLFHFFFPYLLGGSSLPPFMGPLLEGANLAEAGGYIGLLPWILSGLAVRAFPQRRLVMFWLVVAGVALLLALGPATPLGQLSYYLPIYGRFRAPGRHLLEFDLAVSILAGCGVWVVQQRMITGAMVNRAIAIAASVIGACLLLFMIIAPEFSRRAAALTGLPVSLAPWQNMAVGLPLVLFGLSVLGLWVFQKWPTTRWAGVLLLMLITVDLSSFTWFFYWRMGVPQKTLEPTAIAQAYRQPLTQTQQRAFMPKGASGSYLHTLSPNLTWLWNVPIVSGYTPLTLSRYAELMDISESGEKVFAFKVGDQSSNLMGLRYLVMPAPIMAQYPNGEHWDPLNIGLTLSQKPGAVVKNRAIKLNLAPLQHGVPTAINLVSHLGGADQAPANTTIVEVRITDVQQRVTTYPLKAGRDTAEWSLDCPDVKALAKHGPAKVFSTTPIRREQGEKCLGARYLAHIPLNQPAQLATIEFRLAYPEAEIEISKLNLQDEKSGASASMFPMGMSEIPIDRPEWRVDRVIAQVTIYENQRAMPRAWLVAETLPLKSAEVLKTIHTSQLPNGNRFDPAQTALLETPLGRTFSPLQAADTVQVTDLQDTQVVLKTQTAQDAFLVLNDVYYPGWKVTIDGHPRSIHLTNYVQRGVEIPAGRHEIRFEFKPLSFAIGVGVSMASLFGLGYLLLRGSKQLAD
jgi:Bacterial membrane protein YfhO